MAKQIFKVKLVLITLIILLITSCSKDTNTINIQPLKTTIKGELGDYISIVNDKYIITKIKDDLSANWEISFKLKTLKSGNFNTDNSTIDFKLQLVDEKGKPITGLGDFWMATGLFGTVNELNKLREFIKGKENQEDWFTLQMKVNNKDFENKLPKNATHFIIRTIVKGKAISENQNKVKIEGNQDNDILKTIYTGKAENDDIMLKFNNITKDSLFGEHTLQSTANGNIRIKLLKGTYTKGQNNSINAILKEYKLNEFEKPKYKTNGVLKFKISDKNIDGIIDFGNKKINFNLTPIEVSNEEFESRDFGNIYNQNTITKENIIDEMLDEYDKHLQSYEKIFAKSSKGNDTKMMVEIMGVMDEIKITEKKYKKYMSVDNDNLTKSQLARLQNLGAKLNKINRAVSSGDFNSFYEGKTSNTKSTNNKRSNLNIDKMLDEYDEYVKSYVKLLISASKGNTSSLTKSIEVMNKANSFYERLQRIDESKFTLKHMNRMNTINSKMLEAAMKIQN